MAIFPLRELSQVITIHLQNEKIKSVLVCWNIYSLFAVLTNTTKVPSYVSNSYANLWLKCQHAWKPVMGI